MGNKSDSSNPIYVTQPTLPDLDKFIPYLEQIWKSRQLTNNGNFHQELEQALASYLGVKYISLFANGTLALLTALQALELTGEVITSPFSFVAAANAIIWNNLDPVFVDIESEYCTIDPLKIEDAITSRTTAILPVHVYGYPCRIEQIQAIAQKHNLKVIYDGAHAFGNRYRGESLLNYGDLSILSFHATKVFNTFEGGAIVSHDFNTKRKIDQLKNFGFVDELTVVLPGINSKMNEVQAAMGLLQLKEIDRNIEDRRILADRYRIGISGVPGIRCLKDHKDLDYHNYGYYPIFVNEKEYGKTRDKLYSELKDNAIYARRYFYPLISELHAYKSMKIPACNLERAVLISESVLCLPIYPGLETEQQNRIIDLIIGFQG